jgi:hypothetical protein
MMKIELEMLGGPEEEPRELVELQPMIQHILACYTTRFYFRLACSRFLSLLRKP